jgi:hypothetical protein
MHESAIKRAPMDLKASKYLAVETFMSGVSNAILNFAAAYAIFHSRGVVPAIGPNSLFIDSIGETFIVTFLSALIPSLVARHRRRGGTLPASGGSAPARAGNPYVWALVVGLIFTCVCVPCNWILLPRIFPNGVSFGNVLLFKTLYGTIIGTIATFFAIRRALNEVD